MKNQKTELEKAIQVAEQGAKECIASEGYENFVIVCADREQELYEQCLDIINRADERDKWIISIINSYPLRHSLNTTKKLTTPIKIIGCENPWCYCCCSSNNFFWHNYSLFLETLDFF